MRFRLVSYVAALCLTGFIATPGLAAEVTSDDMKAFQQELTNLRQEVKELKSQLHAKKNTSEKTAHQHKPYHVVHTKKSIDATSGTDAADPAAGTKTPGLSREDLLKLIREEREYLPFDMDVPGQSFVSTGPYVGVPIQYAGSHLVINTPSVNTDLQLLKIRRSIMKQLNAMHGEITAEPYHSHLLISGLVEAQASYSNVGGSPSTSDIDVTNMSLDFFFIGPSDWTLGFVELTHDNGLQLVNGYYRVANSRVFVNKAFITIGDLLKSPFYGTVGQYYVPFGTYSSVMVSDTLPKLLARTKARAIELGMNIAGDNAPYAALYMFRGDSHPNSVPKVNNGGLNLGYKFKFGQVSGNVGGGIIANIADSGGMQAGAGFTFYEQLHHRVPAYNLRGIVSVGEHWNFIGEYVGTTTQFNVNDLSFNAHGAKPRAFDTQAAYSFKILDNKPSSVAIGYGHSYQALALGIPLSRYSAVFNTSLWRNTLQSLELRHDRNYAASNSGNGPVGAEAVLGTTCVAAVCTASGKSDNVITAQFDYYF